MNKTELTELYEQYGPMVHRRALAILGNPERAHDVMHDVFVTVWQKGLRNQDGLSSYFYVSATRTALNVLRKHKREQIIDTHSLFWDQLTGEDSERSVALRTDLRRLFAHCDPQVSATASLCLVDQMTLQEAAQALGISVSGVRKRLRKFAAEAESFGLKAWLADMHQSHSPALSPFATTEPSDDSE